MNGFLKSSPELPFWLGFWVSIHPAVALPATAFHLLVYGRQKHERRPVA